MRRLGHHSAAADDPDTKMTAPLLVAAIRGRAARQRIRSLTCRSQQSHTLAHGSTQLAAPAATMSSDDKTQMREEIAQEVR